MVSLGLAREIMHGSTPNSTDAGLLAAAAGIMAALLWTRLPPGGALVVVAGLALAGILLSFLMPILAYGLLRQLTGFDRRESGAVAAHYGSISIVTFIAAGTMLPAATIRGGTAESLLLE